jgi:hypothetical protein
MSRWIPDETGEEGKNYALHFQIGNFFTRRSADGACSERFAKTEPGKLTAQNRANRSLRSATHGKEE